MTDGTVPRHRTAKQDADTFQEEFKHELCSHDWVPYEQRYGVGLVETKSAICVECGEVREVEPAND